MGFKDDISHEALVLDVGFSIQLWDLKLVERLNRDNSGTSFSIQLWDLKNEVTVKLYKPREF